MRRILLMVQREKLYVGPAGQPLLWFDVPLGRLVAHDLGVAVRLGWVSEPPEGASFFELTEAGHAELSALSAAA